MLLNLSDELHHWEHPIGLFPVDFNDPGFIPTTLGAVVSRGIARSVICPALRFLPRPVMPF